MRPNLRPALALLLLAVAASVAHNGCTSAGGEPTGPGGAGEGGARSAGRAAGSSAGHAGGSSAGRGGAVAGGGQLGTADASAGASMAGATAPSDGGAGNAGRGGAVAAAGGAAGALVAPAGTIVLDPSRRLQTIEGLGYGLMWHAYHDDVVYPTTKIWTRPGFVDVDIGMMRAAYVTFEIPEVMEWTNDNDDPNALDYSKLWVLQNPPGLRHASPEYDGFPGTGWPGLIKTCQTILAKAKAVGVDVRFVPTLVAVPPWARNNDAEIAEFAIAALTAMKMNGLPVHGLDVKSSGGWWADGGWNNPQRFAAVVRAVASRLQREHLDDVKLSVGQFRRAGASSSNAAAFVSAIDADPATAARVDAVSVQAGPFHDDGMSAPGWEGRVDRWKKVRALAAARSVYALIDLDSSWAEKLFKDNYKIDAQGGLEQGLEILAALKYGQVAMWGKEAIAHWGEGMVGCTPTWPAEELAGENSNSEDTYCFPMKFGAAQQFYRHVERGAVQIGAESGDADLPVVAFSAPGNRLVVVVINKASTDKSFKLSGPKLPPMLDQTRTTSAVNAKSVEPVATSAAITVPAQSVQTFVGEWVP